jgi:hypothetical protein
MVPQHASGWRMDRARAFPGRLPECQMAALRARHPRGPERPERPRHRLQCGILRDRDEAPRRGARRGGRFGPRLSGAGPLCRAAGACANRVPRAVRLRGGATGRALRPRPVHGRVLPPAAPFARARPDPRARRARPFGVPVDAARQRRDRAHRRRLPVLRRRPVLHFIEHSYSGDPTNWWVPNRACVEAMLRSAGFAILARPEEEVFVCRRRPIEFGPDGRHAVYPARGPTT